MVELLINCFVSNQKEEAETIVMHKEERRVGEFNTYRQIECKRNRKNTGNQLEKFEQHTMMKIFSHQWL